MTIVVTGGAGFIGSNFVIDWLSQSPEKIVVLDALTYAGNLNNLRGVSGNPSFTFVRGDIADKAIVQKIFADHKPRALLNFAAESHVDRSIDAPAEFVRTNIQGTFNLLEIARSYWSSLEGKDKDDFRFLHVSTDEVYGSLGPADAAFTEEHAYKPNSPYSASKAASDHLVRAAYHTYGLPVLTTNCSNNYGPYQFPEKLIPLMITQALSGKPLPVYGDGLNVRDWLYVADHCSAIRRVLDKGRVGETYNIGGESEKSNIDVVHTICDILDRLVPSSSGTYRNQIEFVRDRPGHDRRYAIDCRKIKRELGWSPVQTFDRGLQDTVRWYLDHRDWVADIMNGGYRLGAL